MVLKEDKARITIEIQDIVKVLRILSLILFTAILSFVVIFFGIFSAGNYFIGLLVVVFAIYVVPLTFCFCPHIRQSVVFQTHVDAGGVDLNNPEDLQGVRNLKISYGSDNNVTIGLWHLLPSSLFPVAEGKDPSFWKDSVRNEDHKGVVIYFHGITSNRGKPHRRDLYKTLQNFQYHVISCDYAGFGDSTKLDKITESSLVNDALAVYKWVRQDLLEGDEKIPVFVWGHSLGASISSHAMARLKDFHEVPHPNGVVMEAPFDSFAEELRHHSKLKFWSILPFFDYLFTHPLRKNDIAFQSDGHISKITAPICIMHAKDDNVIPSFLGRRLFDAGRQRRPQGCANPIYFVHLKAGKHNEIYKFNSEFGKILGLFTTACLTIASQVSSGGIPPNTNSSNCWHHNCTDKDTEILCSHC